MLAAEYRGSTRQCAQERSDHRGTQDTIRSSLGIGERTRRVGVGTTWLILSFPRKAGIQALNGIARLTRDLNSYLWVADPRQVPCSAAATGTGKSLAPYLAADRKFEKSGDQDNSQLRRLIGRHAGTKRIFRIGELDKIIIGIEIVILRGKTEPVLRAHA